MTNPAESFIRRTFILAQKAAGFISPNPLVGAIIVKNGKIIAEGYHGACGGNHAERVAILKLAGKKPVKNCARGATLYVNLEPCAHYGKTPPCTDIIIEAGIKKVVFAIRDPNPIVSKLNSIRILQKAGIEVVYPVLEKEARELNKVFLKNQIRKLPYITLKSAVTRDGKIADAQGKSKWITGKEARTLVHKQRLLHDAVLVGKNTVLKDNPRLNIRLPGIKKENYKIILGARSQFPKNTKLLKDPNAFFVTTSPPTEPRGKILVASNLKKLLSNLYKEHNICSILVEGGAAVNTSFLKAGLVDEWQLFIAPKVFGKDALPVFDKRVLKKIRKAKICAVQKLGKDVLLKFLF